MDQAAKNEVFISLLEHALELREPQEELDAPEIEIALKEIN